ncbi:hypothetical protein V6N13_127228 [Hibiscus sabdariffa]
MCVKSAWEASVDELNGGKNTLVVSENSKGSVNVFTLEKGEEARDFFPELAKRKVKEKLKVFGAVLVEPLARFAAGSQLDQRQFESSLEMVVNLNGNRLLADSFEACNSGVGFLCTNIALDLRRKLQAWIDLRRGFEAGVASIMVDCVLLDG